MAERDIIVDKLRLSYEGLFKVTELYKLIDVVSSIVIVSVKSDQSKESSVILAAPMVVQDKVPDPSVSINTVLIV